MRILISGASGFVGAPLSQFLSNNGHTVIHLERGVSSKTHSSIFYDPAQKKADPLLFEGFDAVIHLAGEPLSFSRWTTKKKKKIYQSRVEGTQFLCSLLTSLKNPPKVFISASAVGFYGNRDEEMLNEKSPRGDGFLADVCSAWEDASLSLDAIAVRRVHMRFGIVIGNGGAIAKMLPIYRWGLGSILGSGQQWWSWIHLEDLIRGVSHLLQSQLKGPVNFVSPHPIRQEFFSHIFARTLKRPHFLKIPAPILRLVLGNMAEDMLLSSVHAFPLKLLQSGFSFQYPILEKALKTILT